MTSQRPPAADWDDRRLDVAFRAGFGGEAPTGLVERIVAELDRPQPFGRLASIRRSSLGLLAAAAVVALLVIGSQAGLLTPGPQTGSPRATTDQGSPGPTDDRGLFPPSVIAAKTGEPLPVLSVENALVVRDGGVDSRELAVGGWFIRIPVPCPLWLGPVSPLETCGTNFTWLMADPEPLTSLAGSGAGTVGPPKGPAFNVVTSWIPDRSDVPIAVVFVGHFDDARDVDCLPERLQECADRFVVDQLAWGPQDLASLFPATVAGMQVTTVDSAISVREMGLATELAVAGWYQAPPPARCGLGADVNVWFLEGGCGLRFTWLLSSAESVIHVTPGTNANGSTQVSTTDPSGPAVNVSFGGVAPPASTRLPVEGDSIPIPVVFVGHFHDSRSNLCMVDNVSRCGRRFVVDAVAWVAGASHTLPTLVDWRDAGAPSETQAQLDAATAFLGARSVLNTMLIPGSLIGELEPALASSDLPNAVILSSEPVVWLATVIESNAGPLGPVALTYVIDSRGQVYVDAAGVAFIRWTPAPS
jgi:hypothetical protein